MSSSVFEQAAPTSSIEAPPADTPPGARLPWAARWAGGMLLAAVVAVLVLVPTLRALLVTFQEQATTGLGQVTGTFTLENLATVFSSPAYLEPLRNTMVLAVVVTLGSLLLGGTFAWIIARTNVPFSKPLELFLVIPFFLSPFAMAVAWVMLLAGRSGLLNQFLRDVMGINIPLSIFSAWGVAWVMIISFAPVAYLSLVGVMRGMDSSMEEAALVCGAGRASMLRTVTLPLLRPALISGGMLVFILSAEMYTVPGFLGTPAGYSSLPYKIVVDMTVFPVQRGRAAAAGLILLAITLVGIVIYRWATTRAHRYVTIGGKGSRPRTVDLGRWRVPVLLGLLTYIMLSVVLPMVALVIGSLQRFYGARLVPENLGLDAYRSVFSSAPMMNSIRNTLVVAVVAATLCTFLTALIAYAALRSKLPGSRTADIVASLPIAVPGVVIGLGFLWVYVRTPLYATVWLLILVNVTRWQPFGLGVMKSGLLQVHRELEESARVSGAGHVRVMRDVLIPVLRSSLLASWLFIAIMTVKELAASLLVATQSNSVIAVQTWNVAQAGRYNVAAVLAVIQTLMMIGLFVLARWAFRVDLVKVGAS
jgi:iron(III) transport system permease protein